MIDWKPCYELPRTCSYWEGTGGEIIVVHADGKIYLMTGDEFAARYVFRRPAPGEIRDDLRAIEAEVERLKAENERLRSQQP